jgi:Fe-S cluster assembly protein SufB
MLEFRLSAYRAWLEMEEPHWLKAHYDKLNYQDYSYYSAPSCGNCDDTCASQPGAVQQTGGEQLSKEVEEAFNQLGVPVREGKEVAVDAILTPFRWRPPTAKSWRSRGLFSAPSAKRFTIIRNW